MEIGSAVFEISDILTFLFDSKGASFDQIFEYAWKGSKNPLRERLRLLVATNQIAILNTRCKGRTRRLYHLTSIGFRSISGGISLKEFKKIQLQTEVPNHDFILTEVREKLKNIPRIEDVFSENEIQMGDQLIRPGLWVAQECNSDGLFFINDLKSGRKIGVNLEVEISLKQRFRLAKKLRMYAENSMNKNLSVLWVAPGSILKALQAECLALKSRLNSQADFYFCDLDNCLNNQIVIEDLIKG
jgi:hypothetical protein